MWLLQLLLYFLLADFHYYYHPTKTFTHLSMYSQAKEISPSISQIKHVQHTGPLFNTVDQFRSTNVSLNLFKKRQRYCILPTTPNVIIKILVHSFVNRSQLLYFQKWNYNLFKSNFPKALFHQENVKVLFGQIFKVSLAICDQCIFSWMPCHYHFIERHCRWRK